MTGEALKRKLSPMGKTAAQWADMIGVSDKTIYRMFKSSDVHTATVERLCRALDKPITFLYGAENDVLELAEPFTAHNVSTAGQEEPSPQPCPAKQEYSIEEMVKTLLREKKKKRSDLYRYIGMTEAGMRRMFANHACTNTTLMKIADFFDLPFSALLPYDPRTAEEEAKAGQIQFLRGQLDVYRTAISALLQG